MTTNDQFHINFNRQRLWEKSTWLGIPFWKLPFDAIVIQQLIFEVKPDFIVETGTAYGGSSLFYASILELIGKGIVITIDKEPKDCEYSTEAKALRERRIVPIVGDSVSGKVVKYVNKTVKDKKTMVILDSWHSKDHVDKELEVYNDKVSVGSYLIVEDTHVSGHPIKWKWGKGPYEAVEEFLEKNKDFVVDKEAEKFGVTFNPNGYLKRIR